MFYKYLEFIYEKDFKFLIVAILVLSACGGNNGKKVTIGVASNDTKAWEKVKELAKKMILI